MNKICVFPGTFDPITLGHVDIIQRAIPLFDRIVVAVGKNASKSPMFSAEQRQLWIEEIFKGNEKVQAAVFDGLTVNFCREVGAQYILRGIRYVSDFEYEKAIADANRTLDPSLETFFLTCEPKYTSVASTIVRDIIRNGGDASLFLPNSVAIAIRKN
ncbi:MAG: pantetheine-phosphate adenylyltransferase [Chitinophagaceae bacterium]|jgi:pantetheine-phosphate adenylyltransferase